MTTISNSSSNNNNISSNNTHSITKRSHLSTSSMGIQNPHNP